MQEEECDTSFVFDNVEMDKKTDFIVMPILCDFSNHLNNAKAMYPLVEILTKNELDEIRSGKFEIAIKYSKQALMNSKLSMHLSKQNSNYYFKYTNEENNIAEQGYIKIL